MIQAGADEFSTCERRFFLEQKEGGHCFLVAGEHYYEVGSNWPAPALVCTAKQTQEGIFLEYKEGSTKPNFLCGKRILISFDELRENDVFFSIEILIRSLSKFESFMVGAWEL